MLPHTIRRLRYRPPPRLMKDFETNQEAFKKHFDRETWKHKHVNVISLVDESGETLNLLFCHSTQDRDHPVNFH